MEKENRTTGDWTDPEVDALKNLPWIRRLPRLARLLPPNLRAPMHVNAPARHLPANDEPPRLRNTLAPLHHLHVWTTRLRNGPRSAMMMLAPHAPTLMCTIAMMPHRSRSRPRRRCLCPDLMWSLRMYRLLLLVLQHACKKVFAICKSIKILQFAMVCSHQQGNQRSF
jgi:hypothetical protein